MKQKTGKAKKVAYQNKRANNEPIIGLITLPKPFDASTIPSTLLCSPPSNRSPANPSPLM